MCAIRRWKMKKEFAILLQSAPEEVGLLKEHVLLDLELVAFVS